MAGRYLLIEFDDAATADALRAQIDKATRNGKKYRVVGLFSRPGPNFCRCGTWTTERGKPATTKRGPKFGWYVCTTCMLPIPAMSFLKNLLAPKDIISPPRYDILKKSLSFYHYGLTAQSLYIPEEK